MLPEVNNPEEFNKDRDAYRAEQANSLELDNRIKEEKLRTLRLANDRTELENKAMALKIKLDATIPGRDV